MTTIKLISCVGVRHEPQLISHFVNHYRTLGVAPDDFCLTLNGSEEDSDLFDVATSMLRGQGIRHVELWKGPYTSAEMWERRRAAQGRFCVDEDWVINADIDELHEYPAALSEVIRFCESHGIEAVQGMMVDRLAKDGVLSEVSSEPDLWEQFPISADVMCSVAGKGKFHNEKGTVKLMLHRGRHLPSIGGHTTHSTTLERRLLAGRYLADFPQILNPAFRYAYPFKVHHFKWTASLQERLERRLATPGITKAGNEYDSKILRFVRDVPCVDLRKATVFDESHRPSPNSPGWRSRVRRLRYASAVSAANQYARGQLGRVKRLGSRIVAKCQLPVQSKN